MSRPPHSPSFDLPNDIWGGVQNMKLLIVQLPPRHITIMSPSSEDISQYKKRNCRFHVRASSATGFILPIAFDRFHAPGCTSLRAALISGCILESYLPQRVRLHSVCCL
jgi:hypothetical protein